MDKIFEYIRVLQKKGAIHILVGSFIQKFVAFFGSIFVVRTLSKQEYGLLSYVENIYSYALIFAGLGLSNAVLRYIVLARENEKRAYYNYIIKHSVIRDIVIAMAICVINVFVKYPDDFSEAKLWVPVIAFLTIFQDIVNNGLYAIRAVFKNKLFAYLAVGSSVLLIVGRIIGACVYNVGGVVVSRVVLNAFIGVAIIPICIKMFSKSTYQLDAAKKKEINAYSIQYMITNGLWAIFMLNDLQMLSMFCADSAIVAEYKVAYLLPANISIFATAIGKFTPGDRDDVAVFLAGVGGFDAHQVQVRIPCPSHPGHLLQRLEIGALHIGIHGTYHHCLLLAFPPHILKIAGSQADGREGVPTAGLHTYMHLVPQLVLNQAHLLLAGGYGDFRLGVNRGNLAVDTGQHGLEVAFSVREHPDKLLGTDIVGQGPQALAASS